MKKTYMVYEDKKECTVTLFGSEQLEFILKNNFAGENARFLYQIEADTYDEAMILHYSKMGWGPYKPIGEDEKCTNDRGNPHARGRGNMRVHMRDLKFILIALSILVIVFFERHILTTGFSSLLGWMIDVQRSFNRDLAHHLRDANDNHDSASLWAALGLAFTYGVVHAAGPGHGKFVVTTYFLSHQRRVWRGFLMGTQIAVMHVVSAIIIVLIAHYLAQRFWDPGGDMPGLRTASYACIAAVGFYMLWRSYGAKILGKHGTKDGHTHGAQCTHDHAGMGSDGGKQGLLSLAVGVAPCSGAVLLLIFAFANNLIAIGILMTVAIAVGMALTMIGLGLFTIMARHFVAAHLPNGNSEGSKVGRVVETGGAVLIILFGLSMSLASALG